MKHIKITFALLLVVFSTFTSVAQIVAEDDFETNNLSWQENINPDFGESIITEGRFKLKSKWNNTSWNLYNAKNPRPQILYSDCFLPINPIEGFQIESDIEFKEYLSGFNYCQGFLLDFVDEMNFIAIAITEKKCYYLRYEQAKLVSAKESAIKIKGKEKGWLSCTLKVTYRDNRLKVYIDDIEMMELRRVVIENEGFGLFSVGGNEAYFDNFKVSL